MQTYEVDDYDSKVFETEGLYSIEYKGYSMRPHRREALEILYVENGCCEVNTHNPGNQSMIGVLILPDNFMIVNASVYHDLHVDDDVNCVLKTIELKALKRPLLPVLRMTLGRLLLKEKVTLREIPHFFRMGDTMQKMETCFGVESRSTAKDLQPAAAGGF